MKNVDKGFELLYAHLSHRRKFIRTIWITVLGIIILPVIFYFIPIRAIPFFTSWKWVVFWFAIILISGIIQAVYEYRKWKTEKGSTDLNGETK